MKKKTTIYTLVAGVALTATLASCNDYLDKLPDNRAEINSTEKIQTLLTSAYGETFYGFLTEMLSDNVDNVGDNNPYTDRFLEQVYKWEDVTESNNESPERIWRACYSAISAANYALQAINERGTDETLSDTLRQAKAEALLCRAYNHFILVNVFCKNYNDSTSGTDLGISYIEEPVTTVEENYPRGTVAEDYEKIDRDLQEALPMVGDAYYSVPKYHFNSKAAYAFACRFYLFYEQWQRAIDYANLCIGTDDPTSQLRDWPYQATMSDDYSAISQHWIDASLNCNLLLQTAYSSAGLTWGPYYVYSKYNHVNYIAANEDVNATNIWGGGSMLRMPIHRYRATNLDKSLFFKMPYLFEYTDPVAQIGYRRLVYAPFTTDEVLLNRAEAYVLLKQYAKACTDLNYWMHNFTTSTDVLTPQTIQSFYAPIAYCYDNAADDSSTIKKHLHPAFKIDAEGSVQECMLQCVLGFKRMQTLHEGLRWFDIKRYGIVIKRRTLNSRGMPAAVTDEMTVDDPRRAVQIPQKVIQAGETPNPR